MLINLPFIFTVTNLWEHFYARERNLRSIKIAGNLNRSIITTIKLTLLTYLIFSNYYIVYLCYLGDIHVGFLPKKHLLDMENKSKSITKYSTILRNHRLWYYNENISQAHQSGEACTDWEPIKCYSKGEFITQIILRLTTDWQNIVVKSC